jgi:hypothetical protein
MDERDREVVAGPNRDRQAPAGDGARERDGAAGRSTNGRPGRGPDVDSAVLAAGVGIRAETEGTHDRAVDRPGPRARAWHDEEHEEQSEDKSPHGTTTLLSKLRTWRPR